jgi:hypothetical protein
MFEHIIVELVNANMKLQTYTSTPGLERYPQHERAATWREAHKQLMKDDPEYRKRFHAYLSSVICLSCVVPGVCFFGLGVIGVALDISLTLCLVAAVVWLAFRQQHFMNQRVGLYLQK